MPETIAKRKVLLIADAHLHLIWPLPRLFHQAGAHLVLLAPQTQLFRHSRFVDEWIDLQPGFQETLGGRIATQLAAHRDALVVFTSQPLLDVFFAEAHPALTPNGLNAELWRALADKSAFQAWATARHLPVPPGRLCATMDEAVAWVEQHGVAMLKSDGVHGGMGVRKVTDADEARAAWQVLPTTAGIIVQNYIEGDIGCTELVLQHGRPVAWFASTKERSVTHFGASIVRRLVHPPGMDELVQAVSAASGFHGLCGFDWIQDNDGKLWLLEFHPRTPSGFGWGRYAGVDVPAAVRTLLEDRPGPTRAPLPAEQLARAPLCCYFPAHFWWALTQQPRDLKYWLPGSNAVSWRNVPLDDPRLLAGVLVFALRQLFRRHCPRWFSTP
jgi:glutathione synthase/RimK-type ligase-like ATP-grasp enzyme